jgi:hypothetical protein
MHQRCVASCDFAVGRLGQSHAQFMGCSQCVLPVAGREVCVDGVVDQLGGVTCADSCDAAGDGAAAFRSDFRNEFWVQAEELTCAEPGEHVWPAAHPDIGHRMGEEGAGGSWVCDPCDVTWHLFYGPTMALAPGEYTFGLRNVVLTGTPSATLGLFEVVGDVPGTISREVLPGDFSGGHASELSIEFELTSFSYDVHPRWAYDQYNGATAISFDALYVVRK